MSEKAETMTKEQRAQLDSLGIPAQTGLEILQAIQRGLKDDGKKLKQVEITHEGAKIILPIINGQKMSFETAIEWLSRRKAELERKFEVVQAIQCEPLDGLHAFNEALAEIYGWVESVPTPGFFGPQPPTMVGIATGPNPEDIKQCAYGSFAIPGIEGRLETSLRPDGLHIVGEIKKRHEEEVNRIVATTRRIVAERSIYKGKAIKVSFAWQREESIRWDPFRHAPQFWAVDGSAETSLIFGEQVSHALDVGLFVPIEFSEACRENKVPLKRGVLLHGPYGTGKTLTANVAAIKGARAGWTFLYLESVEDLAAGLAMAARFAPAILFCEDIDRAISGERSMEMDEVLNILDGVDTKGAEILTVFSTNHLERINSAMLRPGRLDTLIEVLPPDAEAAKRLVQLYGRGLLADDVELDVIGERLTGKIPAIIREVVERAKIAAIKRIGGPRIEGKVMQSDLIAAAHAMESHHACIFAENKTVPSKARMLVEIPPGYDVEQVADIISELQ